MATTKTFKFKLNSSVRLESGETGTVIGRAHYLDLNPQYLVRYVANDRNMTEQWWADSALAEA